MKMAYTPGPWPDNMLQLDKTVIAEACVENKLTIKYMGPDHYAAWGSSDSAPAILHDL